MRFRESYLILVSLLALAVGLGPQGCGLSPEKDEPAPVPLPTFPPQDPEDVLENMDYAYENFEYEKYQPLLHPSFHFVIDEDDLDEISSDLYNEQGIWFIETELELARNMLNRNFVPSENADLQIESMELVIDFSTEPEPSNLEDAPENTLEAFVNFDLRVRTVGDRTLDVRSRPIFYFLPDTVVAQDSTFTMTIWRIEDAPHTGG